MANLSHLNATLPYLTVIKFTKPALALALALGPNLPCQYWWPGAPAQARAPGAFPGFWHITQLNILAFLQLGENFVNKLHSDQKLT